jgi:hypothetical protein
MTQRVWILAFTCGLCASLLSGCSLLHWHKDDSVAKDFEWPPDLPEVDPPNLNEDELDSTARRENSGGIKQLGYSGRGPNGVPDDPTDYANRRWQLLEPLFPRAADANGTQADPHVVKALRAFLDKRLPDAIHEIEFYDKSIQEPLLLLLPWVVNFAEGEINQAKPQDVEKFLDAIEGLARRLRPRASLTLGQARFCGHVRGFGMINSLPDDYAFGCGSGGRPGERICLYVEVNHTASRPVGPYFETELAGRLEIRDANGKRVWSGDFPNSPNSSISPRHDYFVIFEFAVPAQLQPGHYSLVVELSDRTLQGSAEPPAYRTARRILPFEVGTRDGSHTTARQAASIQPAGGGVR